MKHQMLEEALACLERGWSVLPLRAGSKRPLLDWHSWQHRLPLAAEVQRWFERWPDANLGIVTGAVSDLLVVDIDPVRGADLGMTQLELRHGRLPPTSSVRTGGGGRHLYFRGRAASGTTTACRGIVLHGDGGYVVAPPSLHLTGRHYAWEGERPSARLLPAAAPGWLADLARVRPVQSGERRLIASGSVARGPAPAPRPGAAVVSPLVAV